MNVNELKNKLNDENELNKIITLMDEGKDREWIQKAYFCLNVLAEQFGEFTTCDLWIALHRLGISDPIEPRSMAVVIIKARNAGFIRSTSKWIKSPRSVNHGRPVRVWEWVQ